jgi:2-methylaconitate cis-trans-isomerase PrpF
LAEAVVWLGTTVAKAVTAPAVQEGVVTAAGVVTVPQAKEATEVRVVIVPQVKVVTAAMEVMDHKVEEKAEKEDKGPPATVGVDVMDQAGSKTRSKI